MALNEYFYKGLEPGTKLFDRFILIRCLGASESGGVYLSADQYRSDKKIVLKVYEQTSSEYDPFGAITLEEELQKSSVIKHRNVLSGKSFFEDEQWIAYTMPYIEGGTLRGRIDKNDLTIPEIVSIITQVAEGVAAIHKQGYVHRDIKPENILLDHNGLVRIADFGVAIDEQKLKRDSREFLVGTVSYLCPEYVCDGYADRRTDIYALGVVGYEMICGHLPWPESLYFERFTAEARNEFYVAAPHLVNSECPEYLSEIIMTAMSPAANGRYHAAEGMLLELEDLHAEIPSSHRETTIPEISPDPMSPIEAACYVSKRFAGYVKDYGDAQRAQSENMQKMQSMLINILSKS